MLGTAPYANGKGGGKRNGYESLPSKCLHFGRQIKRMINYLRYICIEIDRYQTIIWSLKTTKSDCRDKYGNITG